MQIPGAQLETNGVHEELTLQGPGRQVSCEVGELEESQEQQSEITPHS